MLLDVRLFHFEIKLLFDHVMIESTFCSVCRVEQGVASDCIYEGYLQMI